MLSHRVSSVQVFGSAARGDDDEGSDLDLLVEPTAETTLFDIGAIRFELKQLLGVDVDVLTPDALPEKFRAQVLRDARPLRVATIFCGCAINRFSGDHGIVWCPIQSDLPQLSTAILAILDSPSAT